jgi:uncharacterized protein YkwD
MGNNTVEEPNEQSEPTSTVLATAEENGQTQEFAPTFTSTPSFTLTLAPTSAIDSPTSTFAPILETATERPQPTNTAVPPTATTAAVPTSTSTATTEAPGDDGPASCSPGGNSAFETELISLINQERSDEGLPAYSNQSQLTSAARTHSDDMACNNFFSHTSPTTGSSFDRIAAAGYSYSSAGENIAAGYGSPAAVLEGWMNSSGHRANILSENFTQIGIGYAYWEDSDYSTYWTAVFASP